MHTDLRRLRGIRPKLQRSRPPRRLGPVVSIPPEVLQQFAGMWVAWARSDGTRYEIVASGDELGDVLDQVFQRGLRYGVTYQRLPKPDEPPAD